MKGILSLFLLGIASVMPAQEPDSSSSLFKVRDAERSFAKASASEGRKAAFAGFLADEAVIFTDRWITDGKQFWQKRTATPVILKWEPEYMHLSEGRDYGISTGPWEAQEYRPNTQVLSTGYFLSVWEIQRDGSWKVILDAGISCPKPATPLHGFTFPEGDDKALGTRNNNLPSTGFPEIEDQMLSSWKNNASAGTYSSFLSPNVRLMRNGHLPAINADSVNMLLSDLSKDIVWERNGYNVSPSGDLGFTYGNILINGKNKGTYVRIWERNKKDTWKIITDLLSID